MIQRLASYRLPEDFAPQRDLPPRAENPADPGWKRYDRTTLLYDAVHMPDRIRLYLPRTFNLWPLVAEAEIRIDGQPAPLPRRKVYRRFERLDFPWDAPAPTEMVLSSASLGTVPIPVASGDSAPYEGRRVMYTMLRNERLEWVRDWLLFHQREQGANAALITNNSSTHYSSADLLATMQSVPGYTVTEVLEAPLPFGPFHIEKGVDDGKFLQTTLLNLVRDRFFLSADGVLNVDVDELVVRRGQRSAFEVAKRWGYATFRGSWHYATPYDKPLCHADHVLHDPSEKLCPTKYVYVPDSILGRSCLSVHSVEKIARNFFKTRDLHFLHCRGISTSWKFARGDATREGLLVDAGARAAFASGFG